jgi:hypothetical protein
MIIIQGTTPTHTFTLPFDASIVKCARFVYSQDGAVKVIKDTDRVTFDGAQVSTTLTQEDTYSLEPDNQVKLLLRVLTVKGNALVSDPVYLLCLGCECKEVLA